MNCFNHEDRVAVGQCASCGKFLCKECSSKYETILCDDCYQKRIDIQHQQELQEQEEISQVVENTKKDIIMRLVKSVIIFAVAFFITSGWFDTMGAKILFAYGIAGFPYGIKAYNNLDDKVTGFLLKYIYNANSIARSYGMISIIIKLAGSLLFGGFCFPFVLYKDIKNFIGLNQLSIEKQ